MKKVIMITGIHGVGKSHVANSLTEKHGIPTYVASELIRRTGNESDIDKKVTDVNKNQDLLAYAIDNYVSEDLFILDGHTCLLNKDGRITKIDLESFNNMQVVGVIFIRENERVIRKRLMDRDGLKFDVKFLKAFQNTECSHSMELAIMHNAPFVCYNSRDNVVMDDDFLDLLSGNAITKVLSKKN